MMKISIVLDCEDPAALAPFWSQALGYDEVGRQEQYIVLAGDGPVLILQGVREAKTTKNRVHFDVHPDGPIEDEAERLEGIGAVRVGEGALDGSTARWIVMHDPAGNEFCICET